MAGFVHLHNHSEYSLLDGAARIEALAARAAELGMPAVALTDHGVMSGVVDFYQACRAHGVKPILGCEVYVAQRSRFDKQPGRDDDPFHLVLLAENETGYRNLIKLVSRGFTEGFYYKPRVDDELLQENSAGLIALSACLAGEIPRLLLAGQAEKARRRVEFYRDVFGPKNFFLELQDHGIAEQKRVNEGLLKLARDLAVPLVATNDCYYLHSQDALLQDVLLCIQTGKSIDDQNRMRFQGAEFYFKDAQEMAALFPPEAIANTMAIAQRCHVELEFGNIHLPQYELPEGYTAASFLRKLCLERLPHRYPQAGPEVMDRLEYELVTIEQMGYPGYFLIVWDFIDYARRQGIPVGPGRGSAAGSLVAYVLGITNLDPLRYNLLFERFLNPERVTLPDIDVDFCFERRGEVIDYVVNKYGANCVAQIITFGTMAARAAIRDVGRVLDMPYGEVDRLAKLVPAGPGVSLQGALETVPELREINAGGGPMANLLRLALAVEGMPRHASVHAAGVVIAPEPLENLIPLQRTADGAIITQFPMETLERLGLLKMDFLGLRTLTVIDRTCQEVERSTGVRLNMHELPLDDEQTYQLLADGNTYGVFQLESGWVREMLRELKPSRFEDIIAAVALCRPGPMENIPEYVKNKQGQPSYLHPDLEPILAETYGVMVYQEQIMQVAARMAGFTLGQADLLRRAMGKKKKEILDEQRQVFLAGCERNGITVETGTALYDLIMRFANYGFNKAHSAAYALVAYQTAYLKAHYPEAFFASLLTSVLNSSDKVADYVAECRRLGIAVLPPDVNESQTQFTVSAGGIRCGLAAVKNVGLAGIEAILAARQDSGRFTSLADFCLRVNPTHLNRRAVESLIMSGAFDSLGEPRARLLAGMDMMWDSAQAYHRQRQAGQMTFLDFGDDAFSTAAVQIKLPDLPEMPQAQLLEYEKEMIGFYISGHPLAAYQDVLARVTSHRCAQLADLPDRAPVKVGGMPIASKRINTKKGDPMLFFTLEDLGGSVEVIVFPRVFQEARDVLEGGGPFLVTGRVAAQEDEVKVIAESITALPTPGSAELAAAREEATSYHVPEPPPVEPPQWVEIKLPKQDPPLLELRQVLTAYPGQVPVLLAFAERRERLSVDPLYWVDGSRELQAEVESLLGSGSCHFPDPFRQCQLGGNAESSVEVSGYDLPNWLSPRTPGRR